MRVISGKCRSIKLKAPEGSRTRPTTDRIKETLFNMIRPNALISSNFLDIFAGSGAVGIEALSRGANRAVFIEKDKKASACIKENLATTKLNNALVIEKDFKEGLALLRGESFDFVFIDPPYAGKFESEVLISLKENKLLNDNTLIILEAGKAFEMPDFAEYGYELIKEKSYSTNRHLFLIPLKE